MPADVSFRDVSARSIRAETSSPRRLALGVGLMIAAAASVGLWIGIAAGVKALFF